MKMMNEYQMKLEEGNKVTLPESLVNKLLLRKGETVCLIQELPPKRIISLKSCKIAVAAAAT